MEKDAHQPTNTDRYNSCQLLNTLHQDFNRVRKLNKMINDFTSGSRDKRLLFYVIVYTQTHKPSFLVIFWKREPYHCIFFCLFLRE